MKKQNVSFFFGQTRRLTVRSFAVFTLLICCCGRC